MKTRTARIAGLAAVCLVAGGTLTGALATGGGTGPASNLASALSTRTGQTITPADVKAALEDVLKQRLNEGVAAGRITRAQADEMLRRAGDAPLPGLGGPGGPGGHHGPGHRIHDVRAAIATALGMSEQALRQARDDGTTLTELGATKGVSRDALIDAVVTALEKDGPPPGAPRATDAQLKQMATRIVDGRRPDVHHGPGGHGGGAGP